MKYSAEDLKARSRDLCAVTDCALEHSACKPFGLAAIRQKITKWSEPIRRLAVFDQDLAWFGFMNGSVDRCVLSGRDAKARARPPICCPGINGLIAELGGRTRGAALKSFPVGRIAKACRFMAAPRIVR
ncbi:MAG: hypothetical protein AAGK37_07235 [Pseudomonadota bacterium]